MNPEMMQRIEFFIARINENTTSFILASIDSKGSYTISDYGNIVERVFLENTIHKNNQASLQMIQKVEKNAGNDKVQM